MWLLLMLSAPAGEEICACVLLPTSLPETMSLLWILFIAGKMLGRMVELPWRSVLAWVSSKLR